MGVTWRLCCDGRDGCVTVVTVIVQAQICAILPAVQYNSQADQNTHSDLNNGYIKAYATIDGDISRDIVPRAECLFDRAEQIE